MSALKKTPEGSRAQRLGAGAAGAVRDALREGHPGSAQSEDSMLEEKPEEEGSRQREG